jgi:hypothetical protein
LKLEEIVETVRVARGSASSNSGRVPACRKLRVVAPWLDSPFVRSTAPANAGRDGSDRRSGGDWITCSTRLRFPDRRGAPGRSIPARHLARAAIRVSATAGVGKFRKQYLPVMNLRLPSSLRTRPPFRADHVGSFLRPQALLDMRRRWKDRENTARELRDCEDEAIAELVGFQESLGLQGVTDGEFRRETFHGDFINAFEGMEFKQVFKPGTTAAGGHAAPFIAVTTGKLKRPEGGFEVENFRYLHGLTDRVAKQTIPSGRTSSM